MRLGAPRSAGASRREARNAATLWSRRGDPCGGKYDWRATGRGATGMAWSFAPQLDARMGRLGRAFRIEHPPGLARTWLGSLPAPPVASPNRGDVVSAVRPAVDGVVVGPRPRFGTDEFHHVLWVLGTGCRDSVAWQRRFGRTRARLLWPGTRSGTPCCAHLVALAKPMRGTTPRRIHALSSGDAPLASLRHGAARTHVDRLSCVLEGRRCTPVAR